MKKLTTAFFTFLAFGLFAQSSSFSIKDTVKLQNNLRLAMNGNDQSFPTQSQVWGGGVLTLGTIRDSTGSFPDSLQTPYSGFYLLFSSNTGDSIWSKKYVLPGDSFISFNRFHATASKIRVFGLYADSNYFSGIHTWLLDSVGNFISKQSFPDSVYFTGLQMKRTTDAFNDDSFNDDSFILMCTTTRGDYTHRKHGYRLYKYADTTLTLLHTRQDTQLIHYFDFEYLNHQYFIGGINYHNIYYPFVDIFDDQLNFEKRAKHHRTLQSDYYKYYQLFPFNDTMRVICTFENISTNLSYFGYNTLFVSGVIKNDSIAIKDTFGLKDPPHTMVHSSRLATMNDTNIVQLFLQGNQNRYISVYDKNFKHYEYYPKYLGSPDQWNDYGSYGIPYSILVMPNNRVFGMGTFNNRGNQYYTVDTWTITTRPIDLNPLNQKNTAFLHYSCNVFPNPFDDYIKIDIEGNTRNVNILLLTLNGIQVLQLQENKPIIQLNTQNVMPGIYFLRVDIEGNEIDPKFFQLIKY